MDEDQIAGWLFWSPIRPERNWVVLGRNFDEAVVAVDAAADPGEKFFTRPISRSDIGKYKTCPGIAVLQD